MDELTVKEIANSLGIPTETVKSRIKRAKIEPIKYVGPTAIYAPEIVEAIRSVPGKGRPPKAKPEAQNKTKKAAKK
jgi:DNA-binding Lrp family transcriptional regulator